MTNGNFPVRLCGRNITTLHIFIDFIPAVSWTKGRPNSNICQVMPLEHILEDIFDCLSRGHADLHIYMTIKSLYQIWIIRNDVFIIEGKAPASSNILPAVQPQHSQLQLVKKIRKVTYQMDSRLGRAYFILPLSSISVYKEYGFGYFLEQLLCSMHGAFGFLSPQGPCNMWETTSAYNSGSSCSFGMVACTKASTSAAVRGRYRSCNVTNICICGRPLFWNSTAYMMASVGP